MHLPGLSTLSDMYAPHLLHLLPYSMHIDISLLLKLSFISFILLTFIFRTILLFKTRILNRYKGKTNSIYKCLMSVCVSMCLFICPAPLPSLGKIQGLNCKGRNASNHKIHYATQLKDVLTQKLFLNFTIC